MMLSLTDEIPFGKYKGCYISNLIDKNELSYLNWFHLNVKTYTFNKKVLEAIDEKKLLKCNKHISDGIHEGSYGNEYASENGFMEHF